MSDKDIQIQRYNGTDWDSLYPKTKWENISNTPVSYPPTAHTHTIDNITGLSDSLNKRIQINEKDQYNLNTLYDTGLYLFDNGSGHPSGSAYGTCLVLPYRKGIGNEKPDFGTQIYLPNGDDVNAPNAMWYRTSTINSWNPWQKVATTNDIPTVVSASNAGLVPSPGASDPKDDECWVLTANAGTVQWSAGNISANQDISGKQDKITSSNKLSASLISGLATVATSGSYNDLTNKPSIPTKVSQLTNDSNYVTSSSFKEANLGWGGRNITFGYSPVDAGLIGCLGANRLAYANPQGMVIEYSTDGGNTWLDYGASDNSKYALTVGYGMTGQFVTGKCTSSSTMTTNNMLRITFLTKAAQIYTELRKFAIDVSTNGSLNCYCTIRARLEVNRTAGIDTWITLADHASINGWNGWNIINTNPFTTYGNSPDGQYGEIQFIFGFTNYSTTSYYGLRILHLFGFGGVGWVEPSKLAYYGAPYTLDSQQGIYFPKNVHGNYFYSDVVDESPASISSVYCSYDKYIRKVSNSTFINKLGLATQTWVTNKGYTTNTGTVTSVAVKMNGAVKGTVTTSGTIDLGTVGTGVTWRQW